MHKHINLPLPAPVTNARLPLNEYDIISFNRILLQTELNTKQEFKLDISLDFLELCRPRESFESRLAVGNLIALAGQFQRLKVGTSCTKVWGAM